MKTKTMGIIVVALVLCMAEFARATLVNSNSIVLNDVEYYIQTDKPVYNLGENVQILYRVTNLGDEDVTFSPLPRPEWNFWVEKDGEHIWRAVNTWYGSITEFTLSSGESKEFPAFSSPYVWDMRDDEDNLINIGEYEVIGGFDAGTAENYYYSRVAVPITIVPEPGSLVLFAAGLPILKYFRKRRS